MFFQNNFAIFVKSVTKISGKVTKKIRRIYSLNFSVENHISECRVSLKKCPLCASGAETDHPAGITFRPYNTPCCKVFLCPYLLYYPQKNNRCNTLKISIIRMLHLLQTLQPNTLQSHQLHWCAGCVVEVNMLKSDTYM